MNAAEAKMVAGRWVEANLAKWPGLRAAHLVGGITTMAGDAPFPISKDVDVHLVFEDDSPVRQHEGPLFHVLEDCFEGLPIEAGVKPVTEYNSVETILANPEIAHHLTLDPVLYDPNGWLRDMQPQIRREYRRRWVQARVEHERRGIARALGMRQMAAQFSGAAGEVSILGYMTTFIAAVLGVATLDAPRNGSRTALHIRKVLAAYDRLDLYEELLGVLGVRQIERGQVEQFLREGIEAFDLALLVKKTPQLGDHKLHRHLRPYFVASCQSMIDEGFHREAQFWMNLFYLLGTSVIIADGTDEQRAKFAMYQNGFMRSQGMDNAEARVYQYTKATALYDQIFALVDEIVATHPEIMD